MFHLRILQKYVSDPLHINSFLLIISNVLSALFGFLFWLLAARRQPELGVFRSLVGRTDPGEVGDLAGARLFVQPFWITLFTQIKCGVDEHFDEVAVAEAFSRKPALGPEGRDERNKRCQAGIHHQPGHFRHAADVLYAVGFREAQVLV